MSVGRQAGEFVAVDTVIDRQTMSKLQKLAIASCCLIAVVDGFDSQLIGFLAPSIASTLDVNIKSFGPMFSAGLVGLMVGALIMGPLGDKVGRKRILLGATMLFGLLGGLTGMVRSLDQLVIARFLTGLGLGGAMPNLMALAAEYAPKRQSRLAIGLISASFPTGAMIAGLVASLFLENIGWRAVFFIGGGAAIVLAFVLWMIMPESVRYLTLKPANEGRVEAIMWKIWPESAALKIRFVAPARADAPAAPFIDLFREARAIMTLSLWVAFFMNLLILYFIVSWMPALLRSAGLPASAGAMAIAAFSFGGILGSVAEGPLMSVFRPSAVLLVEFATFMVIGAFLTILPLSMMLVGVLAFLMGCTIQGAQAGLNGFAATFYPTSIRSTGVGFCLGIGRVGSIIGPLLGGLALGAGWNAQQIFASGVIPAMCAGLAIVVATLASPRYFRSASVINTVVPQD